MRAIAAHVAPSPISFGEDWLESVGQNLKSAKMKNNPKPPVPQNSRRACLCKDGKTYSRKCCDPMDMQAQGIGFIGGKNTQN
jgi:hypothetical protein